MQLITLISLILLQSIDCHDFGNAVAKSLAAIEKYRNEQSIPGLSVGVSYRASHVWLHSLGYSDLENDVPFSRDTVLRTGSVSKAIQTALVAKLVEQGVIGWDDEIHKYVDERHYPRKQWKGEDVNITLRQLISMTSGVRSSEELRDFRTIRVCHNVTDTLVFFAADPLVAEPGTKYYYSNWGWHLIGAALESVLKMDFEQIMNPLFHEFNMTSTRLSRREVPIAHRSRPYIKKLSADKKNVTLESVALIEDLGRPLPWLPMGGIITNAEDLLTFMDVMITSYKSDGYLKSSTIKELWTGGMGGYGMGWFVGSYKRRTHSLQYIHYSGSVAGSVNTIALIPELELSVAMIANLGGVSLEPIAKTIIDNFVDSIDNIH